MMMRVRRCCGFRGVLGADCGNFQQGGFVFAGKALRLRLASLQHFARSWQGVVFGKLALLLREGVLCLGRIVGILGATRQLRLQFAARLFRSIDFAL
jgi:hypothetical protein